MVAIGMVSHDSANIWFRSHRPGPVTVRWWPKEATEQAAWTTIDIAEDNSADNTGLVTIPVDGERFTPMTRYRYALVHADDGKEMGNGGFETFPATEDDTPTRFSIAVASCHQPFLPDGTLRPDSSRMLTAVRRCMTERNTKFLLMVGDQMYADFPEPLSLFNRDYFATLKPYDKETLCDCTTSTVRRLYQDRYRIFWNQREWQRLQCEHPCLPILDDHDILDNWGSRPVYQNEKWQNVGLGARRAYFDYQGKRVQVREFLDDSLPDSFDYHFCYGNTATFVMDLRSNRTAGDNGQLYSPLQQQAFEDFLQASSNKKVLLVVLSVPVIHLPRFIAKMVAKLPHTGEDFSDRWSTGSHIDDRDRMLKILRVHSLRFPCQKIILLSGDIHIGCVHAISWKAGGPDIYQLTSSPITHKTPMLVQLGSNLLIKANRNVMTRRKQLEADVRLLGGTGGYRANPYGGRNIGMIEIHTPSPGAEPTITFLIYGQKNNESDEPVCVYQSPPL